MKTQIVKIFQAVLALVLCVLFTSPAIAIDPKSALRIGGEYRDSALARWPELQTTHPTAQGWYDRSPGELNDPRTVRHSPYPTYSAESLSDTQSEYITISDHEPQLPVSIPFMGGDFLVNDDRSGGENFQRAVASAGNAAGFAVVAWIDARAYFYEIYVQRYGPSGSPIGKNIRVTEPQAVVFKISTLDVALNDDCEFVVTWEDFRHDDFGGDIYAQRFDAGGNPLGPDFQANDDMFPVTQMTPNVAMNAAGSFVIVWEDFRESSSEIYAQRYSTLGEPLGGNFWVTDSGAIRDQWSPGAAMDETGRFVVTWADERNNVEFWDDDIYAQIYNAAGQPEGANFRVSDDTAVTAQWFPDVAVCGDNGIMFVWYDTRHSEDDVFGQFYDWQGNSLGVNQRITSDSIKINDFYVEPAVDARPGNGYAVAWGGSRLGVPPIFGDAYLQRFDEQRDRIGEILSLKDHDDVGRMRQSAVTCDAQGNVLVVWEDSRRYFNNQDIFGQIVVSTNELIGDNFMVNDDGEVGFQLYPVITDEPAGGFLTAWEDERHGFYPPRIYLQKFDSLGSAVGENYSVIDSTTEVEDPALASAGENGFILVYEDESNREFRTDVYGLRLDARGNPDGIPFKVNDDATEWEQVNPSVAANSEGRFVVTWTDLRAGRSNIDIYAQRYFRYGIVLGDNFKVNDDAGSAWQEFSSVAMDEAGNFIVTWFDQRNYGAGNNSGDIYAQLYDVSGQPVGTNFRVNDVLLGPQVASVVAVSPDGNFVVAWTDGRELTSTEDIYAQRYDALGNPIGVNFRVNDVAGISAQFVSIAINDDGNFMIVWTDEREGTRNILGQKYTHTGDPLASNFSLPIPGSEEIYRDWPDVAMAGNNICCVWEDNRRETGMDIFARIVPFFPESGDDVVTGETSSCHCSDQADGDPDAVGDVNCDSSTDPLDVQYLVQFVYKSQDARCSKAACPYACGDVNCDVSVDPLDMQFLVQFVYKSQDALCDPCAP